MNSIGIGKPIKIVLSYVASLTLILTIGLGSLGTEALVEYAKPYKPYSVILNPMGDYESPVGDNDERPVRIVFMGDSSLFFPPDVIPNNEDFHLYTPGILSSLLDERKPGDATVIQWSYPAANMFDYYCLICKEKQLQPDLTIIPINWNFFGKSMGQEKPEVAAFAPFFERFSSGYRNPLRLKDISFVDHIDFKAEVLLIYPFGFRVFIKENFHSYLAPKFAEGGDNASNEKQVQRPVIPPAEVPERYPMHLSDSNIHFQFFRSAVDAASRRKQKTLFYLNPVNTSLLEEMMVFDERLFNASRELLAENTRRDYIYFFDIHDMLKRDDFFDDLQHYTEAGRRQIAEALADKVVEVLDEDPSEM